MAMSASELQAQLQNYRLMGEVLMGVLVVLLSCGVHLHLSVVIFGFVMV